MGSPAIFAGSRTKLLTSKGLALNSKAIVDYNGAINYITNGHAEINTNGWGTYALSESVTFQDTGDTVTLNSHGLQNGQIVSFSSITTTTGISTNTTYYVVTATTNTFQVASSLGGSALALTNNGSGTLLRANPVTGTGGSPTVTLTRSTTSPLDDTASFVITKDAANRMGEGANYAFTIDAAAQARVLAFTFDYIVGSGTFSAGSLTTDSDVEVWVYDVTNSVLIQPSNYKLYSNSSTVPGRYYGTFQTASNSTSYRLIFQCATPSTSAYTLKIDNVFVGLSTYASGTPITDWSSYTPTIAGLGTCTNIAFKYRQNGDSIDITGTFTVGTAAASLASITLPTGLSIDSTKITISNTSSNPGQMVGTYDNSEAQANSQGLMVTATGTSTSLIYFGQSQLLNTSALTPGNGTQVTANSVVMSLMCTVPILGFSSSVQTSSPYDGRLIAAKYSFATNVSSSTTQPLNAATKEFDTANIVTTGSAWKATAPVPGVYRIGLNAYFGALANAKVYKNGTVVSMMGSDDVNTANSGTTTIWLNAGDYIDVRTAESVSVNNAAGGLPYSEQNITVELLSNPTLVAQSGFIGASYYVSANFAATTTTPINFDSKEFDTYGSVTTSATAWKFTCPVAGFYLIQGYLHNDTGTTNVYISLYKNGSIYKILAAMANTSWLEYPNPSTVIQLNAGDYIDFRPGANTTFSGGTLADSAGSVSYISIIKVG